MTTPTPTTDVPTTDGSTTDGPALDDGGAALENVAAQCDDAGMATAEYAIATLAACGFAGLLLVILQGDQVRGMVTALIERALSVG